MAELQEVTEFDYTNYLQLSVTPCNFLKTQKNMANKTLFQTVKGLFTPPANAVNEAGGTAYKFSPKHALAQYAATGCFSNTYYARRGRATGKKFWN
ncbi:MAG: hypothetical protein HC846_10405 [Blastocatellia bacterium]|nr:hypothetical protein [Blastocatellia bacterium]